MPDNDPAKKPAKSKSSPNAFPMFLHPAGSIYYAYKIRINMNLWCFTAVAMNPCFPNWPEKRRSSGFCRSCARGRTARQGAGVDKCVFGWVKFPRFRMPNRLIINEIFASFWRSVLSFVQSPHRFSPLGLVRWQEVCRCFRQPPTTSGKVRYAHGHG